VLVEYRFADGEPGRLPALMEDLLAQQVDVVVLGDSSTQIPAQEATSTVPLLMTVSSDPVGSGRVQSLSRPGGNVSGQSIMMQDLSEKRLDLLKSTLTPGARRGGCLDPAEPSGLPPEEILCVGVLWSPNRVSDAEWREMQRAARGQGIELTSLEIQSPTDFEPRIA
jgi:putative ABC transport system substrate-binding protein